MSAATMSIARPRCPVVPIPGEPKLILPGCAFASATNSLSVVASTFGLTTTSIDNVGDVGNRDERCLHIEGHLRIEKRVGGKDAGRGHQQRVTVGRRLGDGVGA